MISRARADDLRVFAEFATLNGKNYVEKHPEAWAINELGEQVKPASWFMGVCPTEPGFRLHRRNQLEELLLEYDLDGVWLDYLHWHAQFEEPDPILPETCFCDHCMKRFGRESDLEIPDGTIPQKAAWILGNHQDRWRTWRCEIIYEWTVEMRSIIKTIRPNALIGLYHCPWTDEEFNGARRNILGLDYDLLKKSIEVFSPMVYHARMGREPEWVNQNLTWFYSRLEMDKSKTPAVWPIVQAENNPGIISSTEFETVLRAGFANPSGGVMMFTSHSVADDPEKIEVLKKVYGEK